MKNIIFISVMLLLLVMLPTNDTEVLSAGIGGADVTAALVGLAIAILMRQTDKK